MKRKVFQLTLDSTNRVKHVEKKWNSPAKNKATSVGTNSVVIPQSLLLRYMYWFNILKLFIPHLVSMMAFLGLFLNQLFDLVHLAVVTDTWPQSKIHVPFPAFIYVWAKKDIHVFTQAKLADFKLQGVWSCTQALQVLCSPWQIPLGINHLDDDIEWFTLCVSNTTIT